MSAIDAIEPRWSLLEACPGYRVSDTGRVQSRFIPFSSEMTEEWRDIEGQLNKGYRRVSVRYRDGRRRLVPVHVLVLEAFVGPRPPGMVSCHLNHNPGDNRLCNLMWGTQAENISQTVACDRNVKGETHGMAKLSRGNVREILRLVFVEGQLQYRVAERFGIARNTIGNICSGKSWGRVFREFHQDRSGFGPY